MINQCVKQDFLAVGPPEVVPSENVSYLQPHNLVLSDRARSVFSDSRLEAPCIVPAEFVGTFNVVLPKTKPRQRQMVLTYAVEEMIAEQIDKSRVFEGPIANQDKKTTLALVVSRHILDAFPSDLATFPEIFLVPRPMAENSWAVWRSGGRALVRAADGTGFAVAMDALPMLWAKSGKPSLTSLADPLPTELPATDLSANPPSPDPTELRFRLAAANHHASAPRLRHAVVAGIVVSVTLMSLLGLVAAETIGLRRIAERERATAQAAIATRLPNVVLGTNIEPVLARLSSAPTRRDRGAFLPFLTELMEVLAVALPPDVDPPEFRRLAWSDQDSTMVLLIQATDLKALQTIQTALDTSAFSVRIGPANASNGVAEAEFRITKAEP